MSDEREILIVHSKHKQDYFVYSRHTAQDRSISFESLGILTYLLSKPTNWKTNVTELAKHATKYRVYKALRELRKAGYVTLEKQKGRGRYSAWVYTVYGTCQLIDRQQVDRQLVDNQHTNKVQKKKQSTENSFSRKKRESKVQTPTIPAEQMNPMKDALVEAFGWKWELMTQSEKGLIQVTAKELCIVNFAPDRVASLHAWCKAKFTDFSPRALVGHLSEYRTAQLNSASAVPIVQGKETYEQAKKRLGVTS